MHDSGSTRKMGTTTAPMIPMLFLFTFWLLIRFDVVCNINNRLSIASLCLYACMPSAAIGACSVSCTTACTCMIAETALIMFIHPTISNGQDPV